ncbi:hypothetical protein C2S51_031309 [Perilla frutescens var. frutescens]|nr:hypothetical protein C2S51_031309 [Perilla frutescens var. frutescens]
MAGVTLPQYVVIESVYKNIDRYYAHYYDRKDSPHHGLVKLKFTSVVDQLAHIEIERPKDETHHKNKYVHLRFRHTNKYWCMFNQKIYATSTLPEEDTSNPSCTLFEPKIIKEMLYLIHVQSKRVVERVNALGGLDLVNTESLVPEKHGFTWVNCNELVKLPKLIAVKGDNGKYLKSVWLKGYPYLQFSSDDPNLKETAHEVHLQPDGHVCIKSVYFGKYWRRSPNWIWGDASDEGDKETLFWPVRLTDGKVALRSVANNNFLRRLTTEGKSDCLNAEASTAVTEARFEIKELVEDRKITNVRFRQDEARVFDERPASGTDTAIIVNKSNTEAQMEAKVSYSKSTTHTFSKSLSLSAGVTASIEAEFPIVTASVAVTFTATETHTWDQSKTETKTIEITGTVPVPANSQATVHCMATKGRCSVPFSYTQIDRSSIDGKEETTEHHDGIFEGLTSYNFQLHVAETKPLSKTSA